MTAKSNQSKAVSTYQKRVNYHKRQIIELQELVERKNYSLKQFNEFADLMIAENKITIDDFKKHIFSSKKVRSIIQAKRKK